MKILYTDKHFGQFDAERLEKLLWIVGELRTDARLMQEGIEQDSSSGDGKECFWFGGFGESMFDAMTNSASIEWPNLGIDLDQLDEVLQQRPNR